jgi:hypothetical protein
VRLKRLGQVQQGSFKIARLYSIQKLRVADHIDVGSGLRGWLNTPCPWKTAAIFAPRRERPSSIKGACGFIFGDTESVETKAKVSGQ